MIAQHVGHEAVGVEMIRDLDGEVQAFRERRRGLLRAALVARVDRVDARDDVDVLQEVGEQLGALPAALVQRRIVVRPAIAVSVSAWRTKITVVLGRCSKKYARPSATIV